MSLSDRPEIGVTFRGRVLAVQANFYRVQLDLEPHLPLEAPPDRQLLCTRRARLKKIGQQVMVGDWVRVEEPDWLGRRGAIAEVFPRRTELVRPPVANANQVLLVFALEEPALDPQQLSRFLVTAEATSLRVLLCLSKSDLASSTQQQGWRDRLYHWGYSPILLSLYTGQGLDQLKLELRDQITVVSGPSGVGKSSLINHLIPAAAVRVGTVSERWGQGRHTTRHVELFQLPSGGLLADTPGFNQPTLPGPPAALANYFPEARHRLALDHCQFNDCLHRDEPHCAVRGDWERYHHYRDFLAEAIAQEEQLKLMGDPESTLKQKASRRGGVQSEPKLESKKYRRLSRRTQQQDLQKLYEDAEDFSG